MVGPGQQQPQQRQFLGGAVPGQQMMSGGQQPGQMIRPQQQAGPGQMWRHPQEVTLQQRGPQMAVQGEMLQPGAETRPPPPPALNIPPPPAPPDNPQTDEERKQVIRYEQWLMQQDNNIKEQLKYYETEITKLRKQRKSLNSKQRTLRKNNHELNANDAAELERVSTEATTLQKSLESIRKQDRQHNMLINDHKQKKEKVLQQQGGGPSGGMPGHPPGVPGQAPGLRQMTPGQGGPGWQGGTLQG